MAVHIRVKGELKALDKVLKDKWKLTNMHAFNSKCVIQKYDTPNDILREYVGVRLDLYAKRRERMLKDMRDELPYHVNVVRFIRQQSADVPVPDLRRKTREVCDEMLTKNKFVKIKDGYDYLMNLPIASLTLTNAKKHEDVEKRAPETCAVISKCPRRHLKSHRRSRSSFHPLSLKSLLQRRRLTSQQLTSWRPHKAQLSGRKSTI